MDPVTLGITVVTVAGSLAFDVFDNTVRSEFPP
jgi:hypothetical protein